ncbi:MAG: hypothetical protein HY360_14515 [Verrucomicrobia bacterium]|nr:hypothetical protein [Verrucomicrobiota bacterium]
MFNDDIGPSTGEMGTAMFWSNAPVFFRETLGKMQGRLAQSGYAGYFDINCIVNARGIHPLEFTSRFGYPTIQIQLEGIAMPAGEWLERLARGESFDLKIKRGFQLGVRILVPSYFAKKNNEEVELYHDLAVTFKKPNNLEGVHIEDVKRENGIWRIAGVSGCVLVVTGSGSTVEEARHQVYARIQNIIIPNMFYRTDIGTRWHQDGDRLQTWGYL